jgi:hypothetical protein
MITQHTNYYQFSHYNICYLAFDLSSLLNSLPNDLKEICLIQLN